jgi:hypothetical protein
MRPAPAALWVPLWILGLGVAFGLARLTGPPGPGTSDRSLEALRAGLLERNALVRAHLLSGYLRDLPPDALPATLELVEEHQLAVRPEDVRLLMHAWTRFDAPGAFAWARDWPTPWRDQLMHEAMLAWGFLDGPEALRAVEALGDAELGSRLRPSVLEGWLQSDDRPGVGDYLARLEEPRLRRRLTFALASEAAKDGIDAVIVWAEAVPEDAPNDFKQGSFYHASSVIARSDPERAAAWFEEHRAEPFSDGSIDVIARKWAQHHDPVALFDWLRGLSPGRGEREGEVDGAITAGFRAWLKKDPAAAESWLLAALPDPGLDPAIEELAWTRAQSAPGVAAGLARRIEDDKVRKRTLTRILRIWLTRDPEAANAWLEASGLPESLRQSIVGAGTPAARARRQAAAEPASR